MGQDQVGFNQIRAAPTGDCNVRCASDSTKFCGASDLTRLTLVKGPLSLQLSTASATNTNTVNEQPAGSQPTTQAQPTTVKVTTTTTESSSNGVAVAGLVIACLAAVMLVVVLAVMVLRGGSGRV